MERNIWVISDSHFSHSNIIKYCDRPFENSTQMDWEMVDRWNSVVKPQDKVYHLGDVYMNASNGYISNLLGKLNGHKRLILGNHDNGKDQVLQRYFEKIDMWRMFPEFGLLLSHVPVHKNSLLRKMSHALKNLTEVMLEKEGYYMTNIHGHVHNNPSPEGPYRNVCVEKTNYTPINIEELRVIR